MSGFLLSILGFGLIVALGIAAGRQYREAADNNVGGMVADYAAVSTILGWLQVMLLAAILWRVW